MNAFAWMVLSLVTVPLTDLTGIGAVVGDATVVALGEPAHGAHEPLEFRNRLFRYLVGEQGFTAIAIESGRVESGRIHDFVLGGEGDARAIARENLTWGFGAFEENVELIRWIREYNDNPAHRRKVNFYGFDISESAETNQPLSPELYKLVVARDRTMADNVLDILKREGKGGRVLVFAHNAHVMNGELRGGMWSIFPVAPVMMGQHLRSALGKQLVIIGVSSAANGEGSVDAALQQLGSAPFLLDLRSAPESMRWIDSPQTLRANFTTEMSITPRKAFDALVAIEQLTPAHTH